MQKATYYDSSAIYSGYPYQSANGFGYDANQVQYPRASHVESEYHRPACSLQSPDGSGALQKPGEMAESCDRSAAIQAAQAKVHPESNQPQVPVSGPAPDPQSPGAISQNTSSSSQNGAKSGSPTSTARGGKQIFPWMKESRQNTKQKPSSSSSSGIAHTKHAQPHTTHTQTIAQGGHFSSEISISLGEAGNNGWGMWEGEEVRRKGGGRTMTQFYMSNSPKTMVECKYIYI